MLTAINTKILIAILAALTGIAAIVGVMVKRQADEITKQIDAQEAATYQQTQEREAAIKKARQDYEAAVAKRQAHGSAPGHQSKTWQTYLP